MILINIRPTGSPVVGGFDRRHVLVVDGLALELLDGSEHPVLDLTRKRETAS